MSSPSISDQVPHHFAPNDRRCSWVGSDPLMVAYHDTEWGVPVHGDQKLFEFMVLDAMQSGPNFCVCLRKRQNFSQARRGVVPGENTKTRHLSFDRRAKPAAIMQNRQ